MGVVLAGEGAFGAFFAEDSELLCDRQVSLLVCVDGCAGVGRRRGKLPGLRTARHSASLRWTGWDILAVVLKEAHRIGVVGFGAGLSRLCLVTGKDLVISERKMDAERGLKGAEMIRKGADSWRIELTWQRECV